MKKEECRRDCLFRRLLQQTMLDKVRPKAATLKTESFEMTILRREETTDPTMIIYSKSQGLPLSCAVSIIITEVYIIKADIYWAEYVDKETLHQVIENK